MHAYTDEPEGNAAAFHDGWFRSGDLGHLDERGYLFLTGRLKEIINRGGQKIIPDEIDAVLAAHPAVLEVAAFGIPHPTLGEDVACAVVLRPGANLTANDLRDFARPSLATYKIPRLILFLPVLPRGSTGKPKRLELTQLATYIQPSEASPEDNFADLQRTEMYIAHMWCEILNLPHVDANDDFFLLGGDSLAAVAMLARLDQEFHFSQSLSAEGFLENPTVAGLTHLLEKAAENSSEHISNSIVHPWPAAGQNPLYLIPANSQSGLYFLRLARHLGSPLAVSVVRPLERGPFNPLFYVEEAAQQAVNAILTAQPAGPYVLGGFCAGGVIAAETASRLERLGHAVRLILFDTPNSALPPVLSQGGVSANFYTAKIRSYFVLSVDSRSIRPLGRLLRAAARRGTWALIRKLRPLLQRVYKVRAQKDKLLWSATEVAFYVPSVSNFDILHVIAVTEENAFRDHSRFAWQRFTRGRMTVEYITTDHDSFFVEANLPAIANVVRTWLASETAS
jgi:thioesterase domain-containing protein/acyl carrier protein